MHDIGACRIVREAALDDAESPLPVPFALPSLRQGGQPVGVGDSLGATFDDDVNSRVPLVRSGRQSDIRVGRKVERLLLLAAGAEVQSAVRARQRRVA